jgi:Flp pilus assembly protein protease CpaA
MGIGVSIFLIAVGAILAFAVTASVSGIDLATVGWILMAVGAVGLLMTMMIFGRRGRAVGRDELPPRDPPVY